MNLKTPAAPHIHSSMSVSGLMTRVIIALLPAMLAFSYFFGAGLIIHCIIAIGSGLLFEAILLAMRNRPIEPFLTDGSVWVTAILLCFCLPPLAPWWIVVIGMFFAIAVGKHLYGGLGYNPFNPAMIGYVVLLISFPVLMTQWHPPFLLSTLNISVADTAAIISTGLLPAELAIDSVSLATPLDTLRTKLALGQTVGEVMQHRTIYGDFGGVGWEWIGNWVLLGGIWLIYKKIISWHIPVAVLGGLFIIALLFNLGDPDRFASPMFHVFSGATMLCAFFIATDPVSACTTPKGRIYYGLGIGVLIYVIRTWGGYPDSIAFAVLLLNMAVPTIDDYTKPRVLGHDL